MSDDELIADNLPYETNHDRTIRRDAERIGVCSCPAGCANCGSTHCGPTVMDLKPCPCR